MNGGAKVRMNRPMVDGFLENLGEFGSDIATLAELQAKLAASELRDCARRAALPAGLVAGSIALILGSVPVALLGIAEWLAPALHFSRSVAMLLTGGGVFALAAASAAVGFWRLRRSLDSFRHSREELNRNVAWVKTVLAHSGRVSPRRMR